MCWADKLGVLWAFLVVLFVLILAPDRGVASAALVSGEGLKLLAIVILPVWVFFRLIDWLTGGPARRRGYVRARVIR